MISIPSNYFEGSTFHSHLPSFIFLLESTPFWPSSPLPSNKSHNPCFPIPKSSPLALPQLPLYSGLLTSPVMFDDAKGSRWGGEGEEGEGVRWGKIKWGMGWLEINKIFKSGCKEGRNARSLRSWSGRSVPAVLAIQARDGAIRLWFTRESSCSTAATTQE